MCIATHPTPRDRGDVVERRGHVVHQGGPGLDRGFGHGGVAGVDRYPDVRGEGLDHRQHPAQLLGHVDGVGAGAGRLTADVDDVGTLGHQVEPVGHRRLGIEPAATVGERIRGDVEDAHDQGSHEATVRGTGRTGAVPRPEMGAGPLTRAEPGPDHRSVTPRRYVRTFLAWSAGALVPPLLVGLALLAWSRSVCSPDATDCDWGLQYLLVIPVLAVTMLGVGPVGAWAALRRIGDPAAGATALWTAGFGAVCLVLALVLVLVLPAALAVLLLPPLAGRYIALRRSRRLSVG